MFAMLANKLTLLITHFTKKGLYEKDFERPSWLTMDLFHLFYPGAAAPTNTLMFNPNYFLRQ